MTVGCVAGHRQTLVRHRIGYRQDHKCRGVSVGAEDRYRTQLFGYSVEKNTTDSVMGKKTDRKGNL